MTVRLSSGLRTAIVTNYGLGAVMQYGHIRIYTGAQPDSADLPPTGSLLALVCADGITPVPSTTTGGLELAGGVAPGSLVLGGNWIIKGRASGVPGWWRFVGCELDTDLPTSYFPRIDGVLGESLVLGFNDITPATSVAVASFTLILPPQ